MLDSVGSQVCVSSNFVHLPVVFVSPLHWCRAHPCDAHAYSFALRLPFSFHSSGPEYRAQTNRDRASRTTTKMTSQLHLTCSTNREKNKGRVADGFRQRKGRNNLTRHGSQEKLDYTSRFVCVIPTLSPNIVKKLKRSQWSV